MPNSPSPHLHLGAEPLSHQAKATVVPIEKPQPRAKKGAGLQRREPMERKPSKLKQTPLGRCTPVQEARVAEQVCCVCGGSFDQCDPAHVVDRSHPKMSPAAADDPRAVVPLCRGCHTQVHEGRIDLLTYLEPAWRDSQEWAAGAVGLASALRSITGDRMGAAA